MKMTPRMKAWGGAIFHLTMLGLIYWVSEWLPETVEEARGFGLVIGVLMIFAAWQLADLIKSEPKIWNALQRLDKWDKQRRERRELRREKRK